LCQLSAIQSLCYLSNIYYLSAMKQYIIILLTFLVISCNKDQRGEIVFSGSTPGIKNGVFVIKTLGDSTAFGQNITDGKIPENKHQLKEPGYYNMSITDADSTEKHDPFEIYLEKGAYTIETQPGKLYNYPKITSKSKTQQQLSAFYTIEDKTVESTRILVKQYNNDINTKGSAMSRIDYMNLIGKLSEAQNKLLQSNVLAFKEFVKQYPQSDISTHIMAKLNYEDDPASYYAIYKTLTPEARNSEDGKEIGDKLSHLVKLVVGATAPPITGKMPDGKPFDQKSITSKLILIDFWRASNDISRTNHQKLVALLKNIKDKSSFSILSVSLDSKPDWWTTALKDDHMDWPQVADLKGDDSPNAVNWSISSIPTYYLVDNNWKIVARNLNITNIDLDVGGYFVKHH
jgi:hypothetical protein